MQVVWIVTNVVRECRFVREALPLFVTSEGGGVEWIVWGVVVVGSFVFDQCPNLIGVFVSIVCVHHYISKNIVWVAVVRGIIYYFLLDSLTDVKDGRFI